MDEFETDFASIDVDSAAKCTTDKVCWEFPDIVMLVVRDPCHCVDLCSKDMALLPVVKGVMGEAKEICNFTKTDRIDSICLKAKREGGLKHSTTTISMSDNCM